MKKKALIIGAGPAGLTAAYELLKKGNDIEVVVFEESDCFGGISRTVEYKGNRMDMGGHRFFSKIPEVNAWWDQMLPMQGAPSYDDLELDREVPLEKNGPDPEKEDRVMLTRHRVSRILFDDKFYDYPVSLKPETLKNMGFFTTIKVGFSYLASLLHKRPDDNLENFYINRFGKKLYSMFFEYYTENLWGRHPREIDASWGAQRVKGLSIVAILQDIFGKIFNQKNRKVETSLIEEFIYPKYGPGQLWETVATDIEAMGGEVHKNRTVQAVHIRNQKVVSVDVLDKDGVHNICCDYFLSSMPLKELIPAIKGIQLPQDVLKIAAELPYRDFITVGLLMKNLKISNRTSIKTYRNRIPDTWIYIQERDVKIGRLQIFNNWSPYLVADYKNTVWIGLEYFCSEGDSLWEMDERAFIQMAIKELDHIGIIDSQDVLDSVRIKVKKAYPSYFGSYYELDKVKAFLDTIPNLYCIGRNGQHRYNNMDHSMLTAMEVVDNIRSNRNDKENVWAVNTEEEYHESK